MDKTIAKAISMTKYRSVESKIRDVMEKKDPREYGYEGDMAMTQLRTIIRNAQDIHDMMKPDTDLAEWVQSKITLATDYIQTAADYMKSEMSEAVDNQNEAVISPDEFVPPDQNPKYLTPTKDKPKMSRISRGLRVQRAMKTIDD